MAHISLDGRILEDSQARVSTEDRGLLLGDGLFESMRAYGGRLFGLTAHLDRLRASGEFFRLRLPFSDEEVAAAVAELLELNACPDAYVRLTLTRGEGGGLRMDGARPVTIIHARPLAGPPPEQYRAGAKLIVSRHRQYSASPLARHKTIAYLLRVLARQEAADARANGALLLNEHGQVTGEAVGNVFLARDGRLVTPPVHCGCLPGITRATVIEMAASMGIACEERPIAAGEIFSSDEMFLTGTLVEIMPVRSVDKRHFAQNAPGALTVRLAQAYRERVGASPGA